MLLLTNHMLNSYTHWMVVHNIYLQCMSDSERLPPGSAPTPPHSKQGGATTCQSQTEFTRFSIQEFCQLTVQYLVKNK